MAKYRGPRLRIVRRIGSLPGLTKKISKKTNPPGQSNLSSTKKISQYGIRLREKQKLRFHYGVNERQLLNYIVKSRKRKGSSGRILLTMLEMRLDNILFRLGFAPTIIAAKQVINHGHILVNSKLVNIPSYLCKPRDIVQVKNSDISKSLVKNNLALSENVIVPEYLSLNKELLQAKVNSIASRKSISLTINELLVIEYYSRKI